MTTQTDPILDQLRAAFDRTLADLDRIDLSVVIARCSTGVHIELTGPGGVRLVSHLYGRVDDVLADGVAERAARSCIAAMDGARGETVNGRAKLGAAATFAGAQAVARLAEIVADQGRGP